MLNQQLSSKEADNKLALPLSKTLSKSISCNGARVWNSLPNEVGNWEALPMFYNASVNSSGAHAPPPRLTPGH